MTVEDEASCNRDVSPGPVDKAEHEDDMEIDRDPFRE